MEAMFNLLGSGRKGGGDELEWECGACTYLNALSANRCELCRSKRPSNPTLKPVVSPSTSPVSTTPTGPVAKKVIKIIPKEKAGPAKEVVGKTEEEADKGGPSPSEEATVPIAKEQQQQQKVQVVEEEKEIEQQQQQKVQEIEKAKEQQQELQQQQAAPAKEDKEERRFVVVKVKVVSADKKSEETRRFRLDLSPALLPTAFQRLSKVICEQLQLAPKTGTGYVIKYTDDEGDSVLLSSQFELEEALRQCRHPDHPSEPFFLPLRLSLFLL